MSVSYYKWGPKAPDYYTAGFESAGTGATTGTTAAALATARLCKIIPNTAATANPPSNSIANIGISISPWLILSFYLLLLRVLVLGLVLTCVGLGYFSIIYYICITTNEDTPAHNYKYKPA